MNKKKLVLVLVCAVISVILTIILAPFDENVIGYNTILNIEIALFSVSLTIVALLITILDKYKEKVVDQSTWAEGSALMLIALLFLATVFKSLLVLIPKIDIMTAILLFTIILSMCACFDTTLSVYLLILNLKKVLTPSTTSAKNIYQKELYLVEAYILLNEQHKTSVDDMIKALILEQQINENNQS